MGTGVGVGVPVGINVGEGRGVGTPGVGEGVAPSFPAIQSFPLPNALPVNSKVIIS